MATATRQVRDQLLSCDAEFQRLADEHSRYEAQLDQLTHTQYLSAEDFQLELDLKKRKLRIKDEMERRILFAAKNGLRH